MEKKLNLTSDIKENSSKIEVTSNRAYIGIFNNESEYDLHIEYSLEDDIDDIVYHMRHYKNGDMLFYHDVMYDLNGECFLVRKDGCIYYLLFAHGNLLYYERILKCANMCTDLLPSFNNVVYVDEKTSEDEPNPV